MKRTFCTLFDSNYLPHALTLTDSLKKHVQDFVIYCFCMDEKSFKYLVEIKRPEIIPISSSSLEAHYPELLTAKSNRSKIEYYFTCSASICSYVFDNNPSLDLLTYLDADLRFFSSPQSIYQELENMSIGIIEHKLHGFGKRYEKYGRFNVGWVLFKNDEPARQCLEKWRTDCIDWCYDYLDNGRFGDQKYLDYWPNTCNNVHVIKHLGANLAPWNVGQYRLAYNVEKDIVTVNNEVLIFYHYANFKQVDDAGFVTSVSRYFTRLHGVLRNHIYKPYIVELVKYNRLLGINPVNKGRKDVVFSNLSNKTKMISRNIRRFICSDYISV